MSIVLIRMHIWSGTVRQRKSSDAVVYLESVETPWATSSSRRERIGGVIVGWVVQLNEDWNWASIVCTRPIDLSGLWDTSGILHVHAILSGVDDFISAGGLESMIVLSDPVLVVQSLHKTKASRNRRSFAFYDSLIDIVNTAFDEVFTSIYLNAGSIYKLSEEERTRKRIIQVHTYVHCTLHFIYTCRHKWQNT